MLQSPVSQPSLSNIFLGLNTLTCLAIVWGGGRLLGKMENQLKNHDDLFERLTGLISGIEERVGHLEGRR